MALRIVATRPEPATFGLPWSTPLTDWPETPIGVVVPSRLGLSRHVVRMIRVADRLFAVKETTDHFAFREYRMLRDLHRMSLPAVTPQAVVTGRKDEKGEDLPAVLMTERLAYSLPYRSIFEHGPGGATLEKLVDALVVLLVRLHLADFYWGDVSLSNVLFRRDAGGYAAYLVDAETGELKDPLSDRLREHDVTVGCENVFAELLDLAAGAGAEVDAMAVIERIRRRYDSLWDELTGEEYVGADELWRVERRVERLNDLGFDVDELDLVTDVDGEQIRITPRVVELGHHRRELRELTGLEVEDAQARHLLNDLASYTAAHELGRLPRGVVAARWLSEVYDPITRMIPADQSEKMQAAQIFHEVLTHRRQLSEQAGFEVEIFDAARSYVDSVFPHRPSTDLGAG
ncbi:DUF4032 domain-containing protein [Nocardioides insulae]|uniref:DUF4032 domain-containing protein n=1 Tax=Nocardioides insulae TaxID=394734 RepID=UPI0004212FEE|nr:DUF4032 domain-containing protein [Nocardioides insulae]